MSSKTNSDNTTVDPTGENVDNDVFTAPDESYKDRNGRIERTELENTKTGKSESASREVAADVNNANNQYKPMPIKKKHRRGSRRNKRRKYKPYSKLTWEEKKAVEERDSRRAVSIREKYMHEKGRPLAPFNTSQFLMAEHDTQEPDLHVSHHHHHHNSHSRTAMLSSSADDSDDGDSSSDEDQDIEDVRNFLQKDFTETYDRLHSESLHRMNKDELISEYIQLEDKVENLEKELTVIKSNGVRFDSANGLCYTDVPPAVRQVNNVNTNVDQDETRRNLELEVQKLREENRQLHLENSILRPKQNSKEDHTV